MTVAPAHTTPRRAQMDSPSRAADRPVPFPGRAAACWPPERVAAARLAQARHTLAHAPGGSGAADARWRAIAHRQVDLAEDAAREALARTPQVTCLDEQTAADRARSGLAAMLDPDPRARAAGTDDVTRAWPAEHLRLLQEYADATNSDDDSATVGDDAVEQARAAVAALRPLTAEDESVAVARGYDDA